MKNTFAAGLLNVLGIVASVILSIVFVITATVTPIYYSVAGIAKPKTISTMLQKVDYTEAIQNSENTKEILSTIGIEPEAVNDIMQSKEVGNFLKACSDKMMGNIFGSGDELEKLDSKTLKSLFSEHLDEIAKAAEEKVGVSIPSEELSQGINSFIDQNTEAIDEAIESVETSTEPISEVTKTVGKTLGVPFIIGIILIQVAVLAVIYLIRRKRFGGFIWIAVCNGVVALFLTGVIVAVKSSIVKGALEGLTGFAKSIAEAAVSVSDTSLIIALVSVIVIMAAAITACVLLRKRQSGIEAIQRRTEA